MKNVSRRIQFILVLCAFVLTSCKQNESERLLTGKWHQKECSTNGVLIRTINFSSNGLYVENGKLHYKEKLSNYELEGIRKIRFGNLYTEVKKTSFLPAGREGEFDKNRIIHLATNTFSFLYGNGRTGTFTRSEESEAEVISPVTKP